jgi:branched-subunit amino acid transport protein
MEYPWLVILAMAAVTFLTRYAGLALSGRHLPPVALRWLYYVPVAVLAALVAPAALAPAGQVTFGASTLAMVAGLLVAWRTRNVLWTVLAGMATFWVLRLLGMA